MLLTPWKTASAALFVVCLVGAMEARPLAAAQEPPTGKDTGKKQSSQASQQRLRAEDQLLIKLQRANEVLLQEVDRLRAENEKLMRAQARERGEQTKQTAPPFVLGQNNQMAPPALTERPHPANLAIKVYPVAGLTTPGAPEGREAHSLMRVLSNTIAPQSWKEMGGEGSMEYYPEADCLVIRQTPAVQKQVLELLDNLRRVKKELASTPRSS